MLLVLQDKLLAGFFHWGTFHNVLAWSLDCDSDAGRLEACARPRRTLGAVFVIAHLAHDRTLHSVRSIADSIAGGSGRVLEVLAGELLRFASRICVLVMLLFELLCRTGDTVHWTRRHRKRNDIF